jgi:hypothetical protein
MGSCRPRHRAKELIRFLPHLEKEVPPDQDIHWILDHYSTHKSAAVQRCSSPRNGADSTSISRLPAVLG